MVSDSKVSSPSDDGAAARLLLSGQVKLHEASVVVVGAGGLGCPALQYLAAAGMGELSDKSIVYYNDLPSSTGRIGIVDHDTVELSNLQRQILHTEGRVGMSKALSAAEAIRQYVILALSPLHIHVSSDAEAG